MYSIHFLPLSGAANPLETARKIVKQEEDEPEDFSMDVSRVADAVERVWPALIRDSNHSADDPTAIFTLEDADNDLEIELFSLGALITLPLNRKAVLNEDFWSHLAACGEALQFHGELIGYDPQLDRLMNFPNDGAAVRMQYENQRDAGNWQSQLGSSQKGLASNRTKAAVLISLAAFLWIVGIFWLTTKYSLALHNTVSIAGFILFAYAVVLLVPGRSR
jgi:hypothetical protein